MHRHDSATHLGKEMSSLKITAASDGHKRGSDIIKATAFGSASRAWRALFAGRRDSLPSFRMKKTDVDRADVQGKVREGSVASKSSLATDALGKISTNSRFFFCPSAITETEEETCSPDSANVQ